MTPTRFCFILTICLLVATFSNAAETPGEKAPKPLFEVIELYAPGHFGNSYECMGQYEMRDLLRESKFWGCTRYGDWFDMLDCSEAITSNPQVGLSQTLWDQKKENFRSAQMVGLKNSFVMTPNHVYVNQLLPELRATPGHHILGQVICPSKPEARKLILQNYDKLFADMKKAGVRLDKMSSAPYDYGGCRCEKCDPWILTWAQLTYDIHEVAKKYYPEIEVTIIGWWWKPKEHKLFAEWVDTKHPGWIKAMYLHIPYGKTDVANVVLPKGCVKGAFVHIGYADKEKPHDIYGQYGQMAAPARLEKTLHNLAKLGVTEVMAYSEGVCDNLNKAIFAGISSGKFKTADEVLTAYAGRYFDTDEAVSKRWGKWIAGWGAPFTRDMPKTEEELDYLLANTPDPNNKNVQEWVLKTKLMGINQKLGKGGNWTPERLELAEQYWQTHEKIQRGLWGLGPQRHIFSKRFCLAPWFKSWAKRKAVEVRKIDAEQ